MSRIAAQAVSSSGTVSCRAGTVGAGPIDRATIAVIGMTGARPQASRLDTASTPGSSASCVTVNSQGTDRAPAHAQVSRPSALNSPAEIPEPVRTAILKKLIGTPLKMY